MDKTMRRFKTAILAGVILAGSTMAFSCSLTDIRHNIVKGTLDFVAGYTTDILTGVSPTPPDLFE